MRERIEKTVLKNKHVRCWVDRPTSVAEIGETHSSINDITFGLYCSFTICYNYWLLIESNDDGNGFRCNGTNIYRKNAHVLYETLPEIKNCLTSCTLGRVVYSRNGDDARYPFLRPFPPTSAFRLDILHFKS